MSCRGDTPPIIGGDGGDGGIGGGGARGGGKGGEGGRGGKGGSVGGKGGGEGDREVKHTLKPPATPESEEEYHPSEEASTPSGVEASLPL